MTKARYWCGICYPENMVADWENEIGDLLQIPYAYCIHDKDTLADGEGDRKVHVHVLVAFPNTTTQKHALEVFRSLGTSCINTCEQVFDVRHMYDYLIHDTETCRKKGKHLYDRSERKSGNNFDIGTYEQLGVAEKDKICEEIEDVIIREQIYNFVDLVMYLKSNYERCYVTVLRGNSGYFERIIKGCYHKKQVSHKKFVRVTKKGRG